MPDPVCPSCVCKLPHQHHGCVTPSWWLFHQSLSWGSDWLRVKQGRREANTGKSSFNKHSQCLLRVQAQCWAPGSRVRISTHSSSGYVLHKGSSPAEWGSTCQPEAASGRRRFFFFFFAQWAISLTSHVQGIMPAFF